MLMPLSKSISPHHLDLLPSTPWQLPTCTLSFAGQPLQQNSKRPTFPIIRSSTIPPQVSEEHSSTITTLVDQAQKQLPIVSQFDDDKNCKEVAKGWKEIHGEGDWAGLLDPMDPVLKSELIKYGDMAQACYDAFDYDPTSRYCGSCKYCPSTFFADLGHPVSGYEVTRYLYATSSLTLPNFFRRSARQRSWSHGANWIGFVAVSDDDTSRRIGRRDIVVAWRGTVTKLEWVADLMDFLVDFPGHSKSEWLKVESGFLGLYTEKEKDSDCSFCKYSAREQVLAEIRRLVRHYTSLKEEVSVTITGHSLGAALAVMSAYDIVAKGVNGGAPVSVFSFAGPRVGNRQFKEAVEAAGVKVLRVVNVHDTVPKVPGMFVNERAPEQVRRMADRWLPWSYIHVGVELALNHCHSPFLKDTPDPSCSHNLEAHLHLLDGYHGKGVRFMLSNGRDIALVNKASDFLKDHLLVPPFWRQDENKGMVRGHDGRWIQPERPRIEQHHPDIDFHLQEIGLIASCVKSIAKQNNIIQKNVHSFMKSIF